MRAVKPNGGRYWPCMRTAKRVMAGFPHLYYPSCPELVQRFAGQCVEYGKEHGEEHDEEHDGKEHELWH